MQMQHLGPQQVSVLNNYGGVLISEVQISEVPLHPHSMYCIVHVLPPVYQSHIILQYNYYTDLFCYMCTEYRVNHCCMHRNRCPPLHPDTDSNPQDMGRQQDQKYHPQ